ncbi:MAG: C25 family cysteine peptidase [bacterium]
MEKFQIVVLIFFIFSISSPAQTYEFSSDCSEILLTVGDQQSLSLHSLISQLNIFNVVVGELTFSRIVIPRTHPSGNIGEPQIPVFRFTVEIPSQAEIIINCRIISKHQISLNHPLFPVQPGKLKIPGAEKNFSFNLQSYQNGKVYGQVPVKIIEQGYIRGHHYAALEVYPVQYDLQSQELTVRDEMEIDLIFKGGNLARTIADNSLYGNPFMDRFVQSIMINSGSFKLNQPYSLPVGYLIIAPDAWVSCLDSFAHWKRTKGFQVTVTPLSVAGATSNDIKNYIQNAYDNWDIPPQFLLLVGDDQIPSFNGSYTNSITDLPYSLLSGGDMFPDIWLGRWPVSNISELQNIIAKTLIYEQPDLWFNGDAWVKKAVFMASVDNHSVSENTHRWIIQNYLGPHQYQCDSLWANAGATTSQVSDAFNDGRSLGVFSGHGSPTAWVDGPAFTQSNVNALTNSLMYPMVQSYACYTGKWSYAECFGETWIRAGDKGAVTFWGSSPGSHWTEDDSLERWVFQGIFDSSITWARGFYNYGLYGIFVYGGTVVTPLYYHQAYNLFGDPSLDLWTEYPIMPTVSYPELILVGNVNLTIEVNVSKGPVEYALVAVTSEDSIWCGYTDSTGTADIQVNTSSPCTLNVCVTAHNIYPFQGKLITGYTAVQENPVNNRRFVFCIKNNLLCGNIVNLLLNISSTQQIEIAVVDICGRKVSTVFNETLNAGNYNLDLDLTDQHNQPLTSGSYFLSVRAGGKINLEKFMVVR